MISMYNIKNLMKEMYWALMVFKTNVQAKMHTPKYNMIYKNIQREREELSNIQRFLHI